MATAHDCMTESLRRHEIDAARAQRDEELRQERLARVFREFRGSLGDFIEAFRETSYRNESELAEVHAAMLNTDLTEVGRLVVAMIDKELAVSAEHHTGE